MKPIPSPTKMLWEGIHPDKQNKNMNIDRREIIEDLINLDDPEIQIYYRGWDKGDCSEVGLIEILLYQVIKEHKQDNGDYYDRDYDQIKLRL